MPVEDNFRLNLNQNLCGLFVALVALGAAERFGLCTLYWFAAVLSVVMTVSVAFTTAAYTINYWKNKMK